MAEAPKRDLAAQRENRSTRRKKGHEQYHKYQKPNYSQQTSTKSGIERGDGGIFVTFERGREGKCNAEAVDIFSQYLETPKSDQENEDDANDDDDIEAQIRREVEGMKPSKAADSSPFQIVKLDIECISFIKVKAPTDPVALVHQICLDAEANPEQKRCRWIRRLTPITETRKVLGGGLAELSAVVLKPYFHSGGPPKKASILLSASMLYRASYAIRPSIRQNHDWKRDDVINLVADAVGPRHTVDLKNYDFVILVDVIRKICGMSVVGSDYDRLKRYNLAEIYNPTPKPPKPDTSADKPDAPLPDQ